MVIVGFVVLIVVGRGGFRGVVAVVVRCIVVVVVVVVVVGVPSGGQRPNCRYRSPSTTTTVLFHSGKG